MNPEIADKSQHIPTIVKNTFQPIPLSKTKIKVYKAIRLIIIAPPYKHKFSVHNFFLSIIDLHKLVFIGSFSYYC